MAVESDAISLKQPSGSRDCRVGYELEDCYLGFLRYQATQVHTHGVRKLVRNTSQPGSSADRDGQRTSDQALPSLQSIAPPARRSLFPGSAFAPSKYLVLSTSNCCQLLHSAEPSEHVVLDNIRSSRSYSQLRPRNARAQADLRVNLNRLNNGVLRNAGTLAAKPPPPDPARPCGATCWISCAIMR